MSAAVLWIRGALGKGTLFRYPPSWVPTCITLTKPSEKTCDVSLINIFVADCVKDKVAENEEVSWRPLVRILRRLCLPTHKKSIEVISFAKHNY